jgi:hypothetical protein
MIITVILGFTVNKPKINMQDPNPTGLDMYEVNSASITLDSILSEPNVFELLSKTNSIASELNYIHMKLSFIFLGPHID